jgi:hypothetical protein
MSPSLANSLVHSIFLIFPIFSQLTLNLMVRKVVHAFIPQIILVCYAMFPIAFINSYVGVYMRLVDTATVVVVADSDGHITHVLINRIALSRRYILQSISARRRRRGVCETITDIRVRAGGGDWLVVAFFTFVSTGGTSNAA